VDSISDGKHNKGFCLYCDVLLQDGLLIIARTRRRTGDARYCLCSVHWPVRRLAKTQGKALELTTQTVDAAGCGQMFHVKHSIGDSYCWAVKLLESEAKELQAESPACFRHRSLYRLDSEKSGLQTHLLDDKGVFVVNAPNRMLP